MYRQRFILPVNQTGNRRILSGYNGQGGTGPDQRYVRDDKSLAFQIEPVLEVQSDGGLSYYLPDFDPTDTFSVGLGTPDEPPAGGTFTVTVGSTPSEDLPYDVSAQVLEDTLNTLLAIETFPLCYVALLQAGIYRIDAREYGSIPPDQFSVVSDRLQPQTDAFFTEQSTGSGSSYYQLLFVMRQAPVAYSEPATLLPAAGVSVTTNQAGSSSANKIQTVGFTADNTYGGSCNVACTTGVLQQFSSSSFANPTVITFPDAHGLVSGDTFVIPTNNGSTPTIAGTRIVTYISPTSFSIPVNVTVAGTVGSGYKPVTATCGIATPGMTAEEFGAVLAQHPVINYQNSDGSPDNVSVMVVNGSYKVTFIGTLGASNIPDLAVTNIDLLAPQGVSGSIDLNTIALYYRSLLQQSDVFTLLLEIRRTRTTGEIRTLLQIDWQISKEIIDVASMVPVPRPSYVTDAEVTAAILAERSAVRALTNATISGSGNTLTNIGPGSLTGFPSFSVHKNGTSQTVTGGVATKVTWGTEEWDTAGNFASDRFTPTTAGKYALTVGIFWTYFVTDPGSTAVWIYKNGAAYKRGAFATTDITMDLTIIVDANGSTDYFEVYVQPTVTSDIFGGAEYTFFQGNRLP